VIARMDEMFEDIHQDFRRTLREFVEKELAPHADEWEENRNVPRDVLMRMGDLGFLGAAYPEEYGGGGEDKRMEAVLYEELPRAGAAGVATGVGVHVSIAMAHIAKFGTEEQKQKYLVSGIEGKTMGALGVTEPDAGSDVASMSTTAAREGDEYIINGSKMFITNGVSCDWIVLGAKTDKEAGYAGITLFVVDKDTPGFTVGRKLDKVGLWSSDTAELYFSDCRVPASAILGEENKGFFQIISGFVWERLICAIGSVAGAQMTLEQAIAYAKERKQFGKPIGKFQVVSHELAQLAIDIQAARQLTYWCVKQHLAGTDTVAQAAMAKVLSTEVACKVADRALQIHGGYGYMMEYPVQRAWRDTRVGTIYAGTNDIMREIIAKDLGL